MKPAIRDPLQYAKEIVGGDPFAAYLGIVIEDVSTGYARLSLKVKPEYLNAVGRAHGGTVGMMIDQAFAVAANSRGHFRRLPDHGDKLSCRCVLRFHTCCGSASGGSEKKCQYVGHRCPDPG